MMACNEYTDVIIKVIVIITAEPGTQTGLSSDDIKKLLQSSIKKKEVGSVNQGD